MQKSISYFQHGERIIEAATLENRMYIILDGAVSIILAKGTDRFEVAQLKKGDFFGEISLFTNTPRSASATAVGNVKLAHIDSVDHLKTFLLKNPAFAAKMVQILAQRLANTDEILIGKISELNRLQVTRDL